LWVDISTNGISLTKDRVLELADAGIKCINLSLDTLDPKIYEKHRGVPFKLAQRALTSLSYVVDEYPTIGGTVNCVVTRHNIGELIPFVKRITEYGRGKISITMQPYHRPPSFSEISGELDQEMTRKLCLCYRDRLPENLAPNDESKPIFEKEMEELIRLKRKGLPLRNSETYLKMIPDFLFNNHLPRDFYCLAGYTGVFIRYDLKVLPCYRLFPVGDLNKEDLADIWLSERYRKQRKKMKCSICHGCMFLCYSEPGWSSSSMTWQFYDCLYKSLKIPPNP
jgi:MoaA/NifB/PqqE/SkfB family radical SAM enzyme